LDFRLTGALASPASCALLSFGSLAFVAFVYVAFAAVIASLYDTEFFLA